MSWSNLEPAGTKSNNLERAGTIQNEPDLTRTNYNKMNLAKTLATEKVIIVGPSGSCQLRPCIRKNWGKPDSKTNTYGFYGYEISN